MPKGLAGMGRGEALTRSRRIWGRVSTFGAVFEPRRAREAGAVGDFPVGRVLYAFALGGACVRALQARFR